MSDQEGTLDEVVRLLAILVRRGANTQTDAIVEMSKAGFKSSRIADLLGTTTNTANVTVQKARKDGRI